MNEQKFETQKEAIKYYGHSWKFIVKHYKVKRCYSLSIGFRCYLIKKK